MNNVKIKYNPYTVNTEITVNGMPIGVNSPLRRVSGKRLQEWIEPKGDWRGIFKELRENLGDGDIQIYFWGTVADFNDMEYAKNHFGKCFDRIELVHENKEQAKNISPNEKMTRLKELYEKLQNGPSEEFKSADIRKNFEDAVNSEFRIVIVATMSSGKSTLINSMMGRDLLPAISQASTAVITEIKDNDNIDRFVLNAFDKNGKQVAVNEPATSERISELNYMKDPDDPEKKASFIRRIKLEGPVPNLPSDNLNTVFVDTPGGNNAQNDEHEELMDNAIGDENKSIVLFVFEASQLTTNDSDKILSKIAEAMKKSNNGKQSRDRFIFVANKMDTVDVAKEPYEAIIENSIIPMLEEYGITEPNLFLVSAQTAKLIRKFNNGETFTDDEEDGMEPLLKKFNRGNRALPKFSSLNKAARDALVAEAAGYAAKAGETDSSSEKEALRRKAAEINSGVPALEMAIREYLEKYAIAIKIKTAHDAFMRKVTERDMVNKAEQEWASSQESLDRVRKEIREKRERLQNDNKCQEFRGKIRAIKIGTSEIDEKMGKFLNEMDDLVKGQPEEIKKDEASKKLQLMQNQLNDIADKAVDSLQKTINDGIFKTCQSILNEYAEYINVLDENGMLSIGGIDVRKMTAFDKFSLDNAGVVLEGGDYVETRREVTGFHYEKEKGLKGFLSRLFKGGWAGYQKVDQYTDVEYVKFRDFMLNLITPIQTKFEEGVENTIREAYTKVSALKSRTEKLLDGLEKQIRGLMDDIQNNLENQEVLRQKVMVNKEKAEWVRAFVKDVESILDI